jgi:hypothetical protein
VTDPQGLEQPIQSRGRDRQEILTQRLGQRAKFGFIVRQPEGDGGLEPFAAGLISAEPDAA